MAKFQKKTDIPPDQESTIPALPPEIQEGGDNVADQSGITSEQQAIDYFKTAYQMPEGQNKAYITQDGNVFFKENEGSGRAHARDKKIAIFEITL